MRSAALITSILILTACVLAPVCSVCAAEETITPSVSIGLGEDISPESISPRAVFFHNETITAEIGTVTDANVNLAVFPETANIREFTFESSDSSVATVDREGKITARGKGECVITVTTHNGKTASMTYTVFGTDVQDINIVKYAKTVYAFDVITLQANISPEDASVRRVKWSSSDETVAKVDKNGTVTCGLPGTVMITAEAFGGKKDMFLLTVNERPVTEIHIDPDQYEGRKGERFSLNTVVYPENATFKSVTYTSSNPHVASVDKNGTVLLKGRGKAIITAEAKNGVSVAFSVNCKKTFESVHFKQGDKKWRFSREVAKKACLITSFAIILKNNGIDATPRTAYNAGGTGTNIERLAKKFPFESVSAVSEGSRYFESFVNGRTYIKDPSKNAVDAIKEALDRNPEGVVTYFKRGGEAHAVVAIGYVDDTIYYSDPGRAYDKGFDVTLGGTWVYVGHRMGYKNLEYIIAIDTLEE